MNCFLHILVLIMFFFLLLVCNKVLTGLFRALWRKVVQA